MKNKIMALVILALFLSYVVLSCSALMSDKEKIQAQKEQMASDLFSRVNSVIYPGGFTGTLEWQNIEKRILNNQDTLFYIENPDFKIMVMMRHNMVIDSLKTIQDSVEQNKAEHKGW